MGLKIYKQAGLLAGGTVTGPILLPDGTVGAPSIAFSDDTNTGIYSTSNDVIAFSTGGVLVHTFSTANHSILHNSAELRMGANGDAKLVYDAANVLALRNSTNAQALRVYNSYTDATNYSRGVFDLSSGALLVGTEKGASGSSLDVRLGVAGTIRWQWTGSSYLPWSDNVNDIGQGNLRPKSIYASLSHQGGSTKALTESAATGFVKVAIASGSSLSGIIRYQIEANDATDYQTRSGVLCFSAVNKAGTITAQLFRPDGGTTVDNTTDGVAVSAGTLTNTFTTTQASNELTFLANAASSLTQTTLTITYTVEVNSGTKTTATVTGL